jgi:hypothetical protein
VRFPVGSIVRPVNTAGVCRVRRAVLNWEGQFSSLRVIEWPDESTDEYDVAELTGLPEETWTRMEMARDIYRSACIGDIGDRVAPDLKALWSKL